MRWTIASWKLARNWGSADQQVRSPANHGVDMKGWDDQPIARPGPRLRMDPAGPGLTRLDIAVLVPELALQGSDLVAVVVLEDPDTGEWFGEDPTYPGSALVAIDRERVLPPSPEATAALEQVAASARRMLAEREAQSAAAFVDRGHALALQAAADLPRPGLSDLAVDLGCVVHGSVPPPARWQRTPDGVRLVSVRTDDDPLAWAREWSSTEDVLVVDGPATRAAVAALVAAVAEGPARRPTEIDDDVRRAALEHLAALDPELARLVKEG